MGGSWSWVKTNFSFFKVEFSCVQLWWNSYNLEFVIFKANSSVAFVFPILWIPASVSEHVHLPRNPSCFKHSLSPRPAPPHPPHLHPLPPPLAPTPCLAATGSFSLWFSVFTHLPTLGILYTHAQPLGPGMFSKCICVYHGSWLNSSKLHSVILLLMDIPHFFLFIHQLMDIGFPPLDVCE